MNKKYIIFKQRYKCQSCGKTITTLLDGLVDKYCNYASKIMDLALSIDSIVHTSYRNKLKLVNKELGLTMHRSTAYRHKIKRFGQYYLAKLKE